MIALPSLAIGGIFRMFRKSLVAQIIAGAVAFAGIWTVNNMIVERKAVKKVVIASQKAGTKRNAKTDKIRASIKPSDAMRRLRDEYADNR